ncbi:hypothetical protein D3C87_1097480 [compost metagenome]
MLELTAGTFWQGVGGHDAGGGSFPVVDRQVVEGRLQRAFDFLDRQRLADHTGGIRQHLAGIDAGQLGQFRASALGGGQARFAGAGVGIAGVGQQVTHRALYALLGQDHRCGAKGVQGEHAGNRGAFNTAHDHNILAPRALDAGRGDTEFKTGNRVQRWQRTKTNSHECAPL